MSEEEITELDSAGFDKTLKGTDQLIIVEFYTTTCPSCRAIEPVYLELAKELGKDAVFAKSNIQLNMDLGARFGIMGVPTFKFFCKEKPVGEIVGSINATILRNTIKDFIKHKTECATKSTRISYEMDGYG